MRREETIGLVDVGHRDDGAFEVLAQEGTGAEEERRAVLAARLSKYEYMPVVWGGYWSQWLAL